MQISAFSTSAAMYKNTAWPTIRWTVAGVAMQPTAF
jgi:hypothetical protein